jgi:hypothetical protein
VIARNEPLRTDANQADRLSRGESVPGGPGACARCGHLTLWHGTNGRYLHKPCQRCDCPAFTVPQDSEPRRPQLNWHKHECQRCHQVKPGNGTLCDDCWYDAMDVDADMPDPLPPARPGSRRPDRKQPIVPAGQLALFPVEEVTASNRVPEMSPNCRQQPPVATSGNLQT